MQKKKKKNEIRSVSVRLTLFCNPCQAKPYQLPDKFHRIQSTSELHLRRGVCNTPHKPTAFNQSTNRTAVGAYCIRPYNWRKTKAAKTT